MFIEAQQLTHIYGERTPFAKRALVEVSLAIEARSYVAIVGHTGSGKSTLLQHFNALLKPSSGTMTVGEHYITNKTKEKTLTPLRQKVGIVFQFPEQQLFDETVEKDICYGPLNFGVPLDEAKRRAAHWLEVVGLPADILTKSPFELSGGQMRRVAIAGVLAMEPDVLILDEPTAGLDPRGCKEMMELFYRLHEERGLTTILVTHSMEDAATYADYVYVMGEGRIQLQGDKATVFSDTSRLEALGLSLPIPLAAQRHFEAQLNIPQGAPLFTMEEVARYIARVMKEEQR